MILGIILLIFAYLLYRYAKGKTFAHAHKGEQSTGSSFTRCTQFPMTQEDQRYMDMIKRIDHAFKEQKEQIQTRAMKRHAFECEDPLRCTKVMCFVHEPDRIVGMEEVPIKTKKQRTTVRKKELGLK